MKAILEDLGLSASEAQVYLYMTEHSSITPPSLAKAIRLTRTNAYKVLDRLEELGLVKRSEVNKKYTYTVTDPTALNNILGTERNRLIALEQNVRIITDELQKKLRKNRPASVVLQKGIKAMVGAYEEQAAHSKAIYFIHSHADVAFLGFETMDRIRRLPARHDADRYGIISDSPDSPTTALIDKRTNLQRTWIPSESYTSPVEWSCSDDELLIHIFSGEGELIRIKQPVVIDSFLQIWRMVDTMRRQQPDYTEFGAAAKRKL